MKKRREAISGREQVQRTLTELQNTPEYKQAHEIAVSRALGVTVELYPLHLPPTLGAHSASEAINGYSYRQNLLFAPELCAKLRELARLVERESGGTSTILVTQVKTLGAKPLGILFTPARKPMTPEQSARYFRRIWPWLYVEGAGQ